MLGDDEKVCRTCGAHWPDSRSTSVTIERPVKRERTHDPNDGQASTVSTEPVKTPELKAKATESFIIKRVVKRFKIADLASAHAKVEALRAQLDRPNLVILVLLAILALKIYFATGRLYQYWDGYVYLLNAKSFAEWNFRPPNYFEALRPPLYPFIISRLWLLFGESTILAVLISPIFTFGAAVLLYLLVKEMFDTRAGLVASVGFLLSPIIMINTDPVFVDGVGAFFVTLTVLCLWRARSKPVYYLMAGATIGLASLTRYPDLLIAIVAVIFMLINLKDSPQNRRRILTWVSLGTVSFVGLWLPWLWWCQSVYNDPFISLKLALISGTPGAPGIGPDWLFYVKGLPDLIAMNMPTISSNVVVLATPLIILGRSIGIILGGYLLILGLAMKDRMRGGRGLLLGSWFLVFFVFYSQLANQDLRFTVEWAPPLFTIIGIGTSTFYVFLKRRIRLQRILSVSMVTIVGIWLVLLLLGSVVAEIPTFSPANYEGPTQPCNCFISVTGFQLSTSWLQQHMNQTEIGVTNQAPSFTYYTGRFFYDWGYVLDLATTRHISTNDAFMLLHIKYVVLDDYFVNVNNINLSFLVKRQQFNGYTTIKGSRYAWGYTIYQVSG